MLRRFFFKRSFSSFFPLFFFFLLFLIQLFNCLLDLFRQVFNAHRFEVFQLLLIYFVAVVVARVGVVVFHLVDEIPFYTKLCQTLFEASGKDFSRRNQVLPFFYPVNFRIAQNFPLYWQRESPEVVPQAERQTILVLVKIMAVFMQEALDANVAIAKVSKVNRNCIVQLGKLPKRRSPQFSKAQNRFLPIFCQRQLFSNCLDLWCQFVDLV